MGRTGKEEDKLYCLALIGFTLPHDTKFFIQNGKYNLATPVYRSTTREDGKEWREGHYVRKEIPARYTDDGKLLIPLSQGQFNFYSILVNALFYGQLLVALYLFLGLPIQILITISKGRPFDERNFKRFNLMAWALLAWAFINICSRYVLWFFFRNMITDDFNKPGIGAILWQNSWMIVIAIAVFITGRAFQKGNQLQKEQDLTI